MNRTCYRPSFVLCLVLCLPTFATAESARRVLFIAGGPSHNYGAHEHYAGCRLLAQTLKDSDLDVAVDISRGWPQEVELVESADAIVIYCDGGERHLALDHVEQMQQQIDRGAGFVCLHYAVEVPKGEPNRLFLDWLGGCFEPDWSVNPHWTANFNQLPQHEITHGVPSFIVNDEWYFHMRFQPEMKGVTPILSDVPPDETMQRRDGPHSGNPDVRKAVAAREPQHVAWAYDRPDGGRSFGFTGGHFHWNWGREEFRRLVANAILWTAKVEVPQQGVDADPLGLTTLKQEQDEPPSDDFDSEAIKSKFKIGE
ncbi:MAG: ThuA domain-containing protein [Planctomycetales bacterium]|nr:ThuA domain-containing protein [Planctomycetales bacterium]